MTWKPWKKSPTVDPETYSAATRLQSDFDRFFDRFLRTPWEASRDFFGSLATWQPSFDVRETPDKLVVKAELPGVDSKSLQVSLDERLLTISGEKKEEKVEEESQRHYSESFYGQFQRSLSLPAAVDADQIDAEFQRGVLTITLKKIDDPSRRQIEVKLRD